jgi:hypothetical protein
LVRVAPLRDFRRGNQGTWPVGKSGDRELSLVSFENGRKLGGNPLDRLWSVPRNTELYQNVGYGSGEAWPKRNLSVSPQRTAWRKVMDHASDKRLDACSANSNEVALNQQRSSEDRRKLWRSQPIPTKDGPLYFYKSTRDFVSGVRIRSHDQDWLARRPRLKPPVSAANSSMACGGEVNCGSHIMTV